MLVGQPTNQCSAVAYTSHLTYCPTQVYRKTLETTKAAAERIKGHKLTQVALEKSAGPLAALQATAAKAGEAVAKQIEGAVSDLQAKKKAGKEGDKQAAAAVAKEAEAAGAAAATITAEAAVAGEAAVVVAWLQTLPCRAWLFCRHAQAVVHHVVASPETASSHRYTLECLHITWNVSSPAFQFLAALFSPASADNTL